MDFVNGGGEVGPYFFSAGSVDGCSGSEWLVCVIVVSRKDLNVMERKRMSEKVGRKEGRKELKYHEIVRLQNWSPLNKMWTYIDW